ncbi:hypothetical protein Neosp_000543 [[Neocosmospora] mangrovei]
MSSLQRSRSLRKPTSTATSTTDAERHGSPSRLPIKPLTRSATTASSTTTTRTLRSGSTGLTRSTTVRQPVKTATHEPPRRETTRYPPSTTATRPRPAVRPTSADGQPPQTKRVISHSRAKSTTTGLRNAPVLRPPSSGSSSSSTTTTTTTATRPLRSRTAGSHDKPANAAIAHAPHLRPAFTTLQQHYSPAKSSAPKPLTSTFLAPPSPSKLPANVAASAETSRLQTELLQLHLLHKDATAVDTAWRVSAERKLGDRFSKLAVASKQADDRERAEVERENVLVLRNWATGGGLEERIQTLDAVVNGVWTLGEPGGRYARVVRRFERWVDRMCEIEDARRDGGALLQESEFLFIGELETEWKEEYTGLVRRLETLGRQLEGLGYFPETDDGDKTVELSSLQRMVEGSRTMVEGMLAELAIMEDIERDALAREDDWIERMNREEDVDDTPRAGAIWRVV